VPRTVNRFNRNNLKSKLNPWHSSTFCTYAMGSGKQTTPLIQTMHRRRNKPTGDGDESLDSDTSLTSEPQWHARGMGQGQTDPYGGHQHLIRLCGGDSRHRRS
jgi:hypothetical protein